MVQKQRKTRKGQEKRLDVNEMRTPRWLCGVTEKDIRNEHVRRSVKVARVTNNYDHGNKPGMVRTCEERKDTC